MDIAAVLFKSDVHLLDHPGYDVAYWNIHERPLRVTEDGAVVVGPEAQPLRFYHFSGYWPADADQWAVSFAERNGRPVNDETRRALRMLYGDYEEQLAEASKRRLAPSGYHFGTTAEGRQISASERKAYRAAVLRSPDPASLPNALSREDSDRYRAWHRAALPRRVTNIALTPVSYDLQLQVTDHVVPNALRSLRQVKRAVTNRLRRPGTARITEVN